MFLSSREFSFRPYFTPPFYLFASFTGGDWISTLRYGADGSWVVKTVGNLTVRHDTGRINSSPTADIAPIVRLQAGCNHTISLLGKLFRFYVILKSIKLMSNHEVYAGFSLQIKHTIHALQ